MRYIKINYGLKIFFNSILLFFSYAVFSQSATLLVDKKDILIGEQINIKIQIPNNANNKIIIYIPDSIAHFDVLLKKNIDTITISENKFWQQNITITSFDSGQWTFPPLKYQAADSNYFTDSFRINVGYMPIDSGALARNIKTIIVVKVFNWLWVYVAMAILFGLIVSYFLYHYINNKKSSIKNKRKINAYKFALAELEKLEMQHKKSTLSVTEYHSSLSTIFKTYCSHVSLQSFSNSTTNQVLVKLNSYELQATTMEQTSQALLTGDSAKFAKYNPSFSENETALQFLKNTITEIEHSLYKTT